MPTLQAPIFNKRSLVQITHEDFIHRLDPQGHVADIAENLEEDNEILLDMGFKESNLIEGMTTTVRTGLPKAYWKRYNMGVPPSKSNTATITESSGMMMAMSEVDPDLLELNGNERAFRASEDKAFLQAMNITMANQLFYGDATKSKEGFNGFECRYSTSSLSKAESAKNVIDCGGTQNLSSIYIVGWGDDVFGFYPKGTAAGLKVEDAGKVWVNDENGNRKQVYITTYKWAMGLCVRDWRKCVRLCNISTSDLLNGVGIGTADVRGANTTNLVLKLQQGLDLIKRGGNTHIAIYMNGDVFTGLNTLVARSDSRVIQLESALNRHGEYFSWKTFLGYPLRKCDQLLSTEKKVS